MIVLYGAVDISYTTININTYIYSRITITAKTSLQLIIYLKYDNKRNAFYLFWPTTFNCSLPAKHFKLIVFVFKWYVIIFIIFITFIWLQYAQLTALLHANPNQLKAFRLTNSIDGPLVALLSAAISSIYYNLQTVYIYDRLIEQSEKRKNEKRNRELKNSDNAATCARFAFTTFAAFILIYLLCCIFFTDCR